MRILPLTFYLLDKDIEERFRITREISSLTHRHTRSVLGCFIYLEYARELLTNHNKQDTLEKTKRRVYDFLVSQNIASSEELFIYHRILTPGDGFYPVKNIDQYTEDEISASGYVVHTLEASLWCFLKTESFHDAVLKAVNLGADTDTTAAVTGGLAGLYYGMEKIPLEWLETLARKDDIVELGMRLGSRYL